MDPELVGSAFYGTWNQLHIFFRSDPDYEKNAELDTATKNEANIGRLAILIPCIANLSSGAPSARASGGCRDGSSSILPSVS